MSDDNDSGAFLAHRVARVFMCLQKDVADLTPQQQHALHLYKHEILAATHRLYMTVDPKRADEIIGKTLDRALSRGGAPR